MVTSEDSKVRVFDGVDLIKKYRGKESSDQERLLPFISVLFQFTQLPH
jgi:hypothetical protein